MSPYNLEAGNYKVTVTVQRLRTVDGQSGAKVELRRVREDGHYWPLTTFAGKVDYNVYKRTFSLVLTEAESFDVMPVALDGNMVDFWFDITFEHDPFAGIAELPFDRSAPQRMLPTREDIAVQILVGYAATVTDWTLQSAKTRVDRCFELADEVIRRRDR